MKKNLYYRRVLRRNSLVKLFIIRLFVSTASWPRMLLEVFIRKNFGERYFSFSTAIVIAVFMTILPVTFYYGSSLFFRSYGYGSTPPFSGFMVSYTTWYIFIAGFLFMAWIRSKEIKRNPSVFDFKKFSLYSGDIDQRFYTLKLLRKEPSFRLVECLLEPAFFFAAGVVLVVLGQSIGTMITVCSIIYSLSYVGAYYLGDDFVMDKIDEMICNEEIFDSFVKDKDASETRGVRFYGRKPDDEDVRRVVVESFSEVDNEVFEVA